MGYGLEVIIAELSLLVQEQTQTQTTTKQLNASTFVLESPALYAILYSYAAKAGAHRYTLGALWKIPGAEKIPKGSQLVVAFKNPYSTV